jgi:hypothetical protein
MSALDKALELASSIEEFGSEMDDMQLNELQKSLEAAICTVKDLKKYHHERHESNSSDGWGFHRGLSQDTPGDGGISPRSNATTARIAALTANTAYYEAESKLQAHTATSDSGPPKPQTMERVTTFVWPSGRPNVRVVITGVSAALPGRSDETFPITDDISRNIERIIEGKSCITELPIGVKQEMLRKNVVLLNKNKETGKNIKIPVTSMENNINVSAALGQFSLTQYSVAASIAQTMDLSVQVAVACGLEALKDAGIVNGPNKGENIGTKAWELPPSMQDSTGIVYATSFPALDTAIQEVSKYFRTQARSVASDIKSITEALRERLTSQLQDQKLSPESEKALQELVDYAAHMSEADSGSDEGSYEFDRKFLFRVLVLGNAQLAQIIKARGPNMQTNAACAGSTQAVALAFDMIQTGRAERMLVIAGDNAASDTLMVR